MDVSIDTVFYSPEMKRRVSFERWHLTWRARFKTAKVKFKFTLPKGNGSRVVFKISLFFFLKFLVSSLEIGDTRNSD